MEISMDRRISELSDALAAQLERPDGAFGGLSACPFHRQARTWEHLRFVLTSLTKAAIQNLASEMMWHPEYHILICVEAEGRIGYAELRSLVNELNPELARLGLHAFCGHPDDAYTLNGVEVRRAPHAYIAVVHSVVAEMARDSLSETTYYQGWTEGNFSSAAMSPIPKHAINALLGNRTPPQVASEIGPPMSGCRNRPNSEF